MDLRCLRLSFVATLATFLFFHDFCACQK
ncbi:hypothetical protein CISIN_1g0092412mg, partial [Citrus sinensis]